MNYTYRHFTGFTLAEVLITLGIIGVVAALTIPTLISKYQEKVLVENAKRNYSILMQAIQMYNADNYSANNFSILFEAGKTDEEVLNKLSQYIKHSKICSKRDDKACGGVYDIKFTSVRNNGYGKNEGDWLYGARMVLNDGSYISLWNENKKNGHCGYEFANHPKDENGDYMKNPDGSLVTEILTGNRCGRIWIDTNGTKGPNRYGSDVFSICFYDNKFGSENTDCRNNGKIEQVLREGKIIPYEDYDIGKDFE